MKNKNILKALAALTLGSAAAFGLTMAGCKNHDHTYSDKWSTSETHHWHAATCEDLKEGDNDYMKDYGEHVDSDDNGICDVCEYVIEEKGEEPVTQYTVTFNVNGHGTAPAAQKVDKDGKATAPTAPTADGWTFGGWYTDNNTFKNEYNFNMSVTADITLYAKWTQNSYVVTFNLNGHGTAIAAAEILHGNKLAVPEEPTATNWAFGGWFTDEACVQAYDFDSIITANLLLYAKWTHAHPASTKWSYDRFNHYHSCSVAGCDVVEDIDVHDFDDNKVCKVCGVKQAEYEFVPSDLEATTYATGFTSGIFSILADTTVRTRSRENYNVYDYADGQGNSSSDPIFTGFYASKSVQLNGQNRGISVNAIAPGKLTIYLDNGSGGKTKEDKQTIQLTRPNGSTETISYYCADMYAVSIECDVPGVYKIQRGNATGVGTTDIYYAKFETVVEITEVEKIQIADKGVVDYYVGQDYDPSRLVVQIVRKETGVIEPLDITNPNVNIDSSAFDNTSAGKYTITISYSENGKTFEASYTVNVFAVEALELGFNKIQQGANSSAGNGQYINHAVKQLYFKGDTLDLDGLTVNTVMNNGTQKFIVTEGFTVSEVDMSTAGKKKVTISWDENDSIFAEFYIYVADIAASDIENTVETLIINVNGELQDEAVGTYSNGAYRFKTIQQSIDFLEAIDVNENCKKIINLAEGLYKERIEITIPNLTIRGTATTDGKVDPEKVIIEWDSLVGIADESGFIHITDSTATLNVRDTAVGFVIEGVTISNWYNSTEHFDQAFGPNYAEHRALAMLIQADKVVIDNCRLLGYQDTIELFTGRQVIQNTYICGRTDFIFGTNNTTYFKDCEIESIVSGGYVTAFKGNNKGDGDWIQYGAIFDGCKFTAPATVVSAKDTSLGRTWGKYAAVAYINCDFAGHICTVPYGTAGAKNTRYTAMSGNQPTDATVKFVEYNNTGAGAVNTQIAGMKLLTAEEAVNYTDISVIFGVTNGMLKYANAWDGMKGVEITTKDYKFTAEAIEEATLHETAETGEEIFGGDMIVYALNGAKWRAESSKNQAQFNAGCVIKVNVKGVVNVTTHGLTYGTAENISINYKNGYATITIIATESSPIDGGCYINLISVDTAQVGEHIHVYGDWKINVAAEGEDYGTAVRVCEDCELEEAPSQSVILPALSAENYTIEAGSAAGKATYIYVSEEYGKIVFEADELEGQHTHQFGAWTVTATLTDAGTATRSCTVEGCEEEGSIQTIEIPVLTDVRYTVTNNTATLEAGGEGDYSITLDGVEITFHAATDVLTFNEISESKSISFGSSGNYKEFLDNGTLIADSISGLRDNENSNNNSQISTNLHIKVKAGATVSVSSYNGYTNYDVKVNGAAVGETQTGTSWNYTAEEDCTIDFVCGGNNYFYSITISYGVSEIKEDKTFSVTNNGVENTEYIEFNGIQLHNNSYWLFKNGSSATITLKVAAGATVTLSCDYWGNNHVITVNGEDKTVSDGNDLVINMSDGGELVISSTSNQDVYLQSIVVSFNA